MKIAQQTQDGSYWSDLLSAIYGGHRYLLAFDVLAAATGVARELQRLGALEARCVATLRGAQGMPDEGFAPDPIIVTPRGVTPGCIMEGIREALNALASLPSEAVEQIDAWDPERRARVIGTIFDDGRPVAQRAKFGARPLAWQALEDKTVIDRFWEEAGVPHAPSRVVACQWEALWEAHGALDEGNGTVWAADARQGFHGGAQLTRHATDESSARAIFEHFQGYADKVRVMPFLHGLPCSVHGIVTPQGVVALRPCEMLVFRHRSASTFHYAASATFWDPPAAAREQLRQVARRAGVELGAQHGYRGAFSVDGVLTRCGFLPTELNPRFGAALGWIAMASPEVSLFLLHTALVATRDDEPAWDWRPEQLEALLLRRADARRAGALGMIVSEQPQQEQRAMLAYDEALEAWYEVEDEARAQVRLTYGAASAGGYVRASFTPLGAPIGPSVASRALSVLRWAQARFGLEVIDLMVCEDVSSEQDGSSGA